MKKLLLIVVCGLSLVCSAQKHNLLYKEYQNYDTTVLAYSPIFNVVMPCEIDFNDSIITIGDKQGQHATLKLKAFNISNDRLLYECLNEDLNKPCVVVIYVYGDYRYMEVVYNTKNKFKYRVRTDEVLTLNK